MESERGQDFNEAPELPSAGPSWKRRWVPWLILWAIVLGLLAVFVAQNSEQVEVRLIAWDVNLRMAWALLIASALGFVLGLLLPWLRR
jgi:uncharacterized integral membrane protein